jgi:hypothetical protein
MSESDPIFYQKLRGKALGDFLTEVFNLRLRYCRDAAKHCRFAVDKEKPYHCKLRNVQDCDIGKECAWD